MAGLCEAASVAMKPIGAVLSVPGPAVRLIERPRRGSLFAVLAFSVTLTLWQGQSIENFGSDPTSAAAGLAMAGAYVALLSLLMTARAAGALGTAFAPIRRAVLTNYVVGGPLMVPPGRCSTSPAAPPGRCCAGRSWSSCSASGPPARLGCAPSAKVRSSGSGAGGPGAPSASKANCLLNLRRMTAGSWGPIGQRLGPTISPRLAVSESGLPAPPGTMPSARTPRLISATL